MKGYDELIKKIDLADQVNKEIGGNFGRTMTITMGEALMVKHLLKKQANGVDSSHETALRKHAVNQQREQLAIAALNKIAHPIKYLQDEAEKDGCILDGYMAIQLTKDANFYQEIADKALKAIADCG